jgi:hypothetical protein
MSMMVQTGIAMSGLRHHLVGLAEETAPTGVRVGVLVIGGLILGSDLQRALVPDARNARTTSRSARRSATAEASSIPQVSR